MEIDCTELKIKIWILNMPAGGTGAGAQPKIFQGRGLMELEHFDRHFVKNKKKGPAVQNFVSFVS